MNDIAVVMVTVDRSPLENYLARTLSNLSRSGVFKSRRLDSFHLIDSGDKMGGYGAKDIQDQICYHPSESVKRSPNANVSEAIHVGSMCEVEWILFLEDDIDVCADFLDGVGAWLDKYGKMKKPVFLFGSMWSRKDGEYTEVQLQHFFGTQAFVIRVQDGPSLSDWLEEHEYTKSKDGASYDLLMGDWSKKNWPESNHFAVSSPSFVQHIGMNSVINPRNDVHMFPSWPGKDWSYIGRTC